MTYLTPLLSGFIAAAIGTIPPGLLNMTVAKIKMKEGKKNALSFVIGAVFVIFFKLLSQYYLHVSLTIAQMLSLYCVKLVLSFFRS
ncbi:hypothetical protein ACQ9BO_04380 [Flavobacterium sp. P21]|uniref:hypothetical protein n=1 Tax=Flavobacterium sp. P21 TaxID=3423948 RepID=UPI003D6759F5